MSGAPNISDNDLHAFLDGELEAVRARAVAAELDADPMLAARIADFRADKAMLKTVYGPLAERPLPQAWLARVQGAGKPPSYSWRMAGAIAAVLLVALTTIFVYHPWQSASPGEIVQAALAARTATGTVDPAKTAAVASNSPGHYSQAISTAVSLHLKVPDLSKMGYQLTAIRLYPGAPGTGAAELSYRDKAGRLFTLYLRRSDGTARFDQFEQAGLRVCIWQDDQLGMVMAGNVSTASMQRLASVAYTGLTL